MSFPVAQMQYLVMHDSSSNGLWSCDRHGLMGLNFIDRQRGWPKASMITNRLFRQNHFSHFMRKNLSATIGGSVHRHVYT